MPAHAGIHVFLAASPSSKTWMAGTSPAMTCSLPDPREECASEERQRADLDALARTRPRRRGRIVERRVRAPARAAVLRRIEHLEHQRLVALHAREPVPRVRRIVGDRIGLADAVGIAPL